MIYSTNINLALTGGVGASLKEKFGVKLQIGLQSSSLGTGRQMAGVGEVIETSFDYMPWKIVFHTIATDEFYYTSPDDVETILKFCIKRCASDERIKKVVTSALGAGYGDLKLSKFIEICDRILSQVDTGALGEFCIVCNDEKEYLKLLEVSENFGQAWSEIGE
ncbi:macro domain-containing protein [Rubellicoccus peritrichatus]|uniref:Macro domain-containing protein n=1 Tax=Rubellicoccus peritrichatus TaxID=3080537 RepID=A0AAQ3QY58_9BACT|nr:macro domain-containing protein [Puniceicoccus sp. CR14]WOO43742.1 macro domain-containing protein [Puniceicoccus sp. CR14]